MLTLSPIPMHMQDGLEDGSRACAVLVGQKEMCLTVTDLLVSKGIDKGNILLNF